MISLSLHNMQSKELRFQTLYFSMRNGSRYDKMKKIEVH